MRLLAKAFFVSLQSFKLPICLCVLTGFPFVMTLAADYKKEWSDQGRTVAKYDGDLCRSRRTDGVLSIECKDPD